jgi:hypothetical protein
MDNVQNCDSYVFFPRIKLELQYCLNMQVFRSILHFTYHYQRKGLNELTDKEDKEIKSGNY